MNISRYIRFDITSTKIGMIEDMQYKSRQTDTTKRERISMADMQSAGHMKAGNKRKIAVPKPAAAVEGGLQKGEVAKLSKIKKEYDGATLELRSMGKAAVDEGLNDYLPPRALPTTETMVAKLVAEVGELEFVLEEGQGDIGEVVRRWSESRLAVKTHAKRMKMLLADARAGKSEAMAAA